MDEPKFNLLYKNKETGEVKKFSRDKYRNYESEDGTKMTKNESWSKWTFCGKEGFHKPRERTLPRNRFVYARQKLEALIHANSIAGSDSLDEYITGFIDCLSTFEGN